VKYQYLTLVCPFSPGLQPGFSFRVVAFVLVRYAPPSGRVDPASIDEYLDRVPYVIPR
jgi:hypothetical protein